MFEVRSKVSPSGIISPPSNPGYSGGLLPHFWAILFFVVVAWGWATFSWNKGVEHIKQSDTTTTYFTVIMQYKSERAVVNSGQNAEWQWTDLLGQILADQQAVYRSTDLNSLYQTSFERYFGTIYRVTGDVTLGYRILVFPLNLLYLLGAYALFFHLTGKSALSTAFAFLASFPIAIPIAGEFFGMGPVTVYSRRNLFTAFAPFVIYLFYRWIQKPRLLVIAFAFIGLLSNLHASGILLAEILILTYLLYNKKNNKLLIHSAWFGLVVVVFGFVAMGGLWGKVESSFYSVMQEIIPSAHAALSDFMQKQGIPEGLLFLFYPLRIYSHLPGMLLHAMTLLVIVGSFWVLWVSDRVNARAKSTVLFMVALAILAYLGFSEFKYFLLMGVAAFVISRKQPFDQVYELTHYLILAIFFVSFVGMLLFQTIYFSIKDFPLVSDQLRGTRFLGLMIFVWLAVLISRMEWENVGVWGKRLFIVCSAIALLMTLRQDFRSYIRYKNDPDSIALLNLARWSKMHTHQDSVFLVQSTRFAIVAERNVYLHDRLSRTTHGQRILGQMQGGLFELKQLARETGMNYIVVKKDQVELPAGTIPVYDNTRYALIKVD